jgi:hypothetical protein
MERIKVFSKSAVDIAGLLKSVEIDVSNYVNTCSLFICTKICYKRVLKLQRLQNELNRAKQTFRDSFSNTRKKRLLANSDEVTEVDSSHSDDGTCSKGKESTVCEGNG